MAILMKKSRSWGSRNSKKGKHDSDNSNCDQPTKYTVPRYVPLRPCPHFRKKTEERSAGERCGLEATLHMVLLDSTSPTANLTRFEEQHECITCLKVGSNEI
jgi:hypothetical protein